MCKLRVDFSRLIAGSNETSQFSASKWPSELIERRRALTDGNDIVLPGIPLSHAHWGSRGIIYRQNGGFLHVITDTSLRKHGRLGF